MDLKGLILDMDGVLWRGDEPMPGLIPFFRLLRQRGIAFVLATNNSSQTVGQYVKKLAGLGVEASENQIITSAVAAADYVATIAEPGARVYAIGELGLRYALEARGFRLTADDAGYVVAGLDRSFHYSKIAKAMTLLMDGARFIGTNPDLTLPTPDGPRPGAGAVLAAISAASGITPTIIGKPEPPMFQQALTRLDTDPIRTAMVGDRLDTDILGGINAGIKTILLLSGVTDQDDLLHSPYQPTWVFENISELADALSR